MRPSERKALIEKIGRLPAQVKALVANLTAEQLTTPNLEGEWTVAQNVHHLADSHSNSYIRCKLIATEEHPTLKPYDQDLWALFPDASEADLSTSLAILTGLHARWVRFWEALPDEAWERTGFHPEIGIVTLQQQLASYAAHGEGHLEQISRTLEG